MKLLSNKKFFLISFLILYLTPSHSAEFEINFKRLSNLSIDFSYPYTYLDSEFNVTRRDGVIPIPIGGYNYPLSLIHI